MTVDQKVKILKNLQELRLKVLSTRNISKPIAYVTSIIDQSINKKLFDYVNIYHCYEKEEVKDYINALDLTTQKYLIVKSFDLYDIYVLPLDHPSVPLIENIYIQ